MTEWGTGAKPTLLVFSDDWGRHPSSCQHLIGRLLPEYQVWWVNTIGMRCPRFDRATLDRGLEKIRQWFRPNPDTVHRPTNPGILNPWMWPWFSKPHDRRMNRELLTWQIMPVIRSSQAPVVAVTTVPLVADLTDHLPVARWVYYCVDDFSQWPGLDQEVIGRMEQKLVRRANVLFSVSHKLQDRLAGWGRASHLLTHGVDLEYWTRGGPRVRLPQLERLKRPLVLFWGIIDRRMDVQFVHQLAGDMNRGTVVLLGPEADPDPLLYRPARVVRLPEVPFDQLPHMAREAAVLVMPYADLPVTRAIQPLKLKEYLATGKPVVVRDLPATRPWADALDLVHSPEEFSEIVRRRAAEGVPETQVEARGRLRAESWAEKARRFKQLALVSGLSQPDKEGANDGD